MKCLAPHLHQGRYLTRDLMVAATDEPEEAEKDNATFSIFKAVECLTKGIEVPLPDGHHFQDKDGQTRSRVRLRWWDESATTYRAAAIMSPEEREALPDLPIPAHAQVAPSAKPVFFGHYWLTGAPSLQTARAACVDYSVGKGGPLVAYRFEGERDLAANHFVWID